MRGWRLGALLALLALLASGCTMARLGYDLLPAWSSWQLDRYLALDEDQRVRVSRLLAALPPWHPPGQPAGYAAVPYTPPMPPTPLRV